MTMESYDLSLQVVKSPYLRHLVDPAAYGNCQSCGVSFSHVTGMKIPGLPGFYQNVLCAEQAIIERGCRWCGEKLESGSYCGAVCEKAGKSHHLGDGARLNAWLEKHGAKASAVTLPHAEERKCLHCGCTLEGKRSDARFCDDACKKAFHRRGKPKTGQIAGTNTPIGVGFERVDCPVGRVACPEGFDGVTGV